MGKGLQRTVLAALFLVGLAVFSYPYAQGFLVKREMESTVQTFQEQKETQPTTSVVISDSTLPSKQRQYADLWIDMTAYNDTRQLFGAAGRGIPGSHLQANAPKQHRLYAAGALRYRSCRPFQAGGFQLYQRFQYLADHKRPGYSYQRHFPDVSV